MQPGGAQAPAPSPFEPGEIKVGDENLVRPWENEARYKVMTTPVSGQSRNCPNLARKNMERIVEKALNEQIERNPLMSGGLGGPIRTETAGESGQALREVLHPVAAWR
jgi:hypothetical protein